MRVCAISDFHGIFPKIPALLDQEIDLLLCPGDIAGGSHYTNEQYRSMHKFFKWVKDINPKHCVIVPGNHDYFKFSKLSKFNSLPNNIHCLIDESIDIEGLKIYGTPWSLPFNNWNWMQPDDRLKIYYDNIPEDTNILLTHGPVYGVCDIILNPIYDVYNIEHLGSKSLLNALLERNIDRVFSGHIHTADHNDVYLASNHKTICSCVSILDEQYKIKYGPKIIEI